MECSSGWTWVKRLKAAVWASFSRTPDGVCALSGSECARMGDGAVVATCEYILSVLFGHSGGGLLVAPGFVRNSKCSMVPGKKSSCSPGGVAFTHLGPVCDSSGTNKNAGRTAPVSGGVSGPGVGVPWAAGVTPRAFVPLAAAGCSTSLPIDSRADVNDSRRDITQRRVRSRRSERRATLRPQVGEAFAARLRCVPLCAFVATTNFAARNTESASLHAGHLGGSEKVLTFSPFFVFVAAGENPSTLTRSRDGGHQVPMDRFCPVAAQDVGHDLPFLCFPDSVPPCASPSPAACERAHK